MVSNLDELSLVNFIRLTRSGITITRIIGDECTSREPSPDNVENVGRTGRPQTRTVQSGAIAT